LDDDNTLNKSGIPHNGTIVVVPHHRGKDYGRAKKKTAATASRRPSTRAPPPATEPEQDAPQGPLAQLPDVRHVGSIPGVRVGTKWDKRIEVAHAGVHRSPMSGIAGKADNENNSEEGDYAMEAEADNLFDDDAGSVKDSHAATPVFAYEGPSDEDERLQRHHRVNRGSGSGSGCGLGRRA
ncbi:hypothetical protein BGX33_000303, partial [Mortierella sp. NVP41]